MEVTHGAGAARGFAQWCRAAGWGGFLVELAGPWDSHMHLGAVPEGQIPRANQTGPGEEVPGPSQLSLFRHHLVPQGRATPLASSCCTEWPVAWGQATCSYVQMLVCFSLVFHTARMEGRAPHAPVSLLEYCFRGNY